MTACNKCGADFEQTQRQARIHSYECKRCCGKREAAYRARRKASGNPVNPVKKCKPRLPLRFASPERRAALNAAQRLRYATDPVRQEKVRVRRQVRCAIESGLLERQPCEDCGSNLELAKDQSQ